MKAFLFELNSSIQSHSIHSRQPFFFEADGGIRDLTVTGVQTCALPISASYFASAVMTHPRSETRLPAWRRSQIGRASCRERGVDLGGRRIIKKKKNKKRTRSGSRATRDGQPVGVAAAANS